jgi:uncharacterized protein
LLLSLNTTGKEPTEFVLQARSEDFPELVDLGCGGELTAKVKSVPTVTSHLYELIIRGSITLDCGRCLDKLTGAFQVKLRLLVEKKETQGLKWEENEDLGVEEYLAQVGPDILEIPLEHPIAEQIILNYNLHPLPSLDDKDRCLQCNRQAFQAEAVKKDRVDPRWAKLRDLNNPQSSNGAAG